jgi:hypothetical protein
VTGVQRLRLIILCLSRVTLPIDILLNT